MLSASGASPDLGGGAKWVLCCVRCMRSVRCVRSRSSVAPASLGAENVTIKKLTVTKPTTSGKAPRVAMAIEPHLAQIIRGLARHERLELSELLEQAVVAWVRRWRPEYELKVEGPEGPPEHLKIIGIADGGPRARGTRPVAIGDDSEEDLASPAGRATRISKREATSHGAFLPNPPSKTRQSRGNRPKK